MRSPTHQKHKGWGGQICIHPKHAVLLEPKNCADR
jgi:hypothetical protein